MTDDELFRLQGLQRQRWQLPLGVHQSKLRHAIGNAMSGNVIKAIMEAALMAMGYEFRLQPIRRRARAGKNGR